MFGEKLVTVHVVCPKLATATAVAINIASILGFKDTDHAEAKLFKAVPDSEGRPQESDHPVLHVMPCHDSMYQYF